MARTIDITIPDLTGRLAVVTGASDGIGQVIATRLASAGGNGIGHRLDMAVGGII